jgi:hypothetical protein
MRQLNAPLPNKSDAEGRHEGNCKAAIFALGGRPSSNCDRTSPVAGACDMPQAPWPAAINTPPCAPPRVFTLPSFSSGIRDTIGRPLEVTGRKHCRYNQQSTHESE